MELDLQELRNEIDQINKTLVTALEARLEAVLKVAAYKEERKLQVFDREREEQVLATTASLLKNPRYAPALKAVMERIMEVSRDLEIELIAGKMKERQLQGEPVKVGYQGVAGSFSHEALEDYFNGVPKAELNYLRFEDVVKAVKNNEIKYGILPIENSSTGGITEVYDLVRTYDCHIVGEKCLKVVQNLVALPGARLEQLTKVYSHPQGFEQSRPFFSRYPQIEQIPFFNTAKSAKMVSESGDLTIAAVASAKAAQLYGLQVLAADINSESTNTTRFIIIANTAEARPDADKITVVVSVKHEPGSLYKTLGTFYECGLNMLNLESRPIGGRSWEYFFHIDLTGNLSCPQVREALARLGENCVYCKVLGNYVADKKA